MAEVAPPAGPDLCAAKTVSAEVSPPRRPVRNLAAATGERRAVREQRRLEIERELRRKLGLAEEEEQEQETPAYPSAGCSPREGTAVLAAETPRPRPAASAPSSSSTGGHGPPRPPKPKPHRPLGSSEPAQPSAAAGLRWRSALLPVWPDRGGSPGPSSPSSTPRGRGEEAGYRARARSFSLSAPGEAVCLSQAPDKGGASGGSSCSTATGSPAASPAASVPSEAGSAGVAGEDPQQSGGLAAPVLEALHRQLEESKGRERARQLEESAKRLRENAQRLRVENRRHRVFRQAPLPPTGRATPSAPSEEPRVSSIEEVPGPATRQLEELRRKIAALDELQELERERLEDEQREAEARRQAQEAFERSVQERTERKIRELREREARDEAEKARREDEERREREERTRRWREQRDEEERQSRRLEEQRREGRTVAAQEKLEQLEKDLERQWAEQDEEERRRVEDYARLRRKQYEDFDKKLMGERQRFATGAEFTQATRRQQARQQAAADEHFYGPRRTCASTSPHPSPFPPPPPRPAPPPAATPCALGEAKGLSSEEKALLRELQSVRSAPRDAQKAKVKDLLFRWHPDKNPQCAEKATKLFQFLQRQRELVLGL